MKRRNWLIKLIKTALFIMLITSSFGCATVILNNQGTLNPSEPDQVRFADPICLNLEFKREDLGFFNQAQEMESMNKTNIVEVTLGLPYYNILLNCEKPVAKYAVVYRSKTRNWWARSVWAISTIVTLGVIPFYVNEVGTVSVYENDKVVAETEYSEERLTSILMIPKWIIDNKKTVDTYRLNAQLATKSRLLASVLKIAVESKSTQKKK